MESGEEVKRTGKKGRREVKKMIKKNGGIR